MKLKVGDLIKFNHDNYNIFGHGIVLEISRDGAAAKIRWFDDWDDEEIAWEAINMLHIISES